VLPLGNETKMAACSPGPTGTRKLQSIERRCGCTMGCWVGYVVAKLEPQRVPDHGVYDETSVSRPLKTPIVGNHQRRKLG
jgi:hypothetical protein